MTPRVLVIDDNEWLAKLLARRLEHGGLTVRVALNSIEALDLIDDFHPNVIILDLLMPGPNGLVLLHELQSHDDLGRIPVVVCTTSAREVTLEQLRPYGVRLLLDKTTMQPDDIMAAVRKVLP